MAVGVRERTNQIIERLRACVPLELREYKQWVAWRSSHGTGRKQKIPVDPITGKTASVSDPKTWASFAQAIGFFKNGQADGIGFVLTKDDPFIGVDLDDCRDAKKNELDEDVWNYLKQQRSYAEVSPSGTGLHVLVKGTVPRNIRKGGVEIYADKRFLTVTGRRVPELSREDIAEGGSALQNLWKKLEDQQQSVNADAPAPVQTPDAELQRIIEEAGSAQNGAKFKRLWVGNTDGYASKSEADLALCRILALHTGGQSRLVDRLFRRSALMRPKWDEVHDYMGRTYGQMTTAKARRRALNELKSKYEVRSADELRERGSGEAQQEHLIEGLVPRKSLGIVVGHSNLGKSPLMYQAGICVAAGVPFLGHDVQRARALYLDFENGSADTNQLIRSISGHLGLTQPPRNFLCWSLNSATKSWNQKGWFDMMRSFRPSLVIVDSLTAFDPEIENRNSNATRAVLKFREIIREIGASVLGTHHLVKPSSRGESPEPLEKCKQVRGWFNQARGASALINATDVRIGVEAPSHATSGTDPKEEIAMVMRGFARVRGEIPLIYVARVFNKDGEPVGYNKAVGSRLLFNPDQENAYNKLPTEFRFKDAQHAYDRGPQATSDFTKKCIALGILERTTAGYRKHDTGVCGD